VESKEEVIKRKGKTDTCSCNCVETRSCTGKGKKRNDTF